ncbi:hypothetical protein [Kitasatospora sp. NPDC002040]|uniref:hypothetical protein n=1 Tax=Kitasatospora sp. NPDC002040 TaxID=3154661 RepID=UPI00332CC23E
MAAVALLVSLAATVEAGNPENFPGLRANHGLLVLVLLAVTVLAAAAAVVLAAPGPRLRAGAVAVLSLLLVGGAGCRAVTVAPMLHCLGHIRVSQQDDGSYRCYD